MKFHGSVTLTEDIAASEAATQIGACLDGHKVVTVHGLGEAGIDKAFWDVVVEHLGEVDTLAEDYKSGSRVGERWMEVRFDPSVEGAFRHVNAAQPLHTDGSYLTTLPPVELLFCRNAAATGGETVFMDVEEVIRLLGEEDPELLEELMAEEWTFRKADQSRRAFPLRTEPDARANWNYFCTESFLEGEPSELSQRFKAKLDAWMEEGRPLQVGLKPGEAVLFRDELVMHGRNSFQAEKADDRYLLKAAFWPWNQPK